ncbi:MAG: phosphonate C-P lyase system protein PhnH [Burkholderiaceae bacterium]|nr:phosphonate C-P lyase system protein PhnH [Burkholderiaceae bacterium]
MQAQTLSPAFSDPVTATQEVFRLALSALAEPGTLQLLTQAPALAGLAPATYALCLSLLDSDTPLWLAPALDTPTLRTNLAFHCGCPIVASREQAAFALLTATELNDLSDFNPGSDSDPDQSCTLLIQLDTLDACAQQTLQGPGILHQREVRIPAGAAFWTQRRQHRFPQGLDVFFTADKHIMGLPRSTHVIFSDERTL